MTSAEAATVHHALVTMTDFSVPYHAERITDKSLQSTTAAATTITLGASTISTTATKSLAAEIAGACDDLIWENGDVQPRVYATVAMVGVVFSQGI